MVSRRVDLDHRLASPAFRLLSSVLHEELDQSGLSKTEFCKRIGVTSQYLNLILLGRGNPSLLTLDTIMQAIGRLIVFPELISTRDERGAGSTDVSRPVIDRLTSLLNEEMEFAGISRAELARRTNIGRFFSKQAVRGSANPSLITLEAMLSGLSRSVAFPKREAWLRAAQQATDQISAHIPGEAAIAPASKHKRHAGGRPRQNGTRRDTENLVPDAGGNGGNDLSPRVV